LNENTETRGLPLPHGHTRSLGNSSRNEPQTFPAAMLDSSPYQIV